MKALDSLVQQTSTLVDEIRAAVEPRLPAETPALVGLREAQARLGEERFDVAIVGEVNAGKSTLVNALFFGSEVVPMKATACTAKLTIIEWAEVPSVDVVFLGADDWSQLERRAERVRMGLRDPIDESAAEVVQQGRALGDELRALLGQTRTNLPFEALGDYAAANGRYTPVVGEVRLRYKHALGPRVRIVDTPGLRDPVAGRSRITQQYLGKASVVVVALYAGTPMSRDDYDMLKEQLVHVGVDKLLIALNKIDAVDGAHADRVVEYVNAKLAELRDEVGSQKGAGLLEALGRAQALPVSGLLALLAKTEGAMTDSGFHEARLVDRYGFHTYPEALRMSGVPQLEAAITEITESRDGRARVGAVLRRAEVVLGAARHAVQSARHDATNALADADKKVEELTREQEEWRDAKAKFAEKLRDAGQAILAEVEVDRPRKSREIHERVNLIAQNMTTAAEAHISRLGGFTAFGSSIHRDLNATLQWKVREAHGIDAVIREYLDILAGRMPGFFEKFVRDAMREVGATVEEWTLEHLGYLRNAEVPEFASVGVSEIADADFWTELFTPATARAQMKERVEAAISTWRQETLARANHVLAEVVRRVQADYVEPALAELRNGGEQRIAQIDAELARRAAADPTDARRRGFIESLGAIDGEDAVLHALEVRLGSVLQEPS
jgi:GTP-binding protein EngB required for normal cell division